MQLRKRERHELESYDEWHLHRGRLRTPLCRVVPDDVWHGMWRIVWPDGERSDMVNLTRAKDAAMVLVQRRDPGIARLLHWDRHETALEAGAMSSFASAADEQGATAPPGCNGHRSASAP